MIKYFESMTVSGLQIPIYNDLVVNDKSVFFKDMNPASEYSSEYSIRKYYL